MRLKTHNPRVTVTEAGEIRLTVTLEARDQGKLRAFLAEKLKDAPARIDIDKWRNPRSTDANNYHWKLCALIADATGQTSDEVHASLMRDYGQGEHVFLPETAIPSMMASFNGYVFPGHVTDGGYQEVLLVYGSHTYDTKEMSTLLNGTIRDAQELGIETRPQWEIEALLAAYESERRPA